MAKKPLLIAMIDDEKSIRKAICRLLRSHGLKVEPHATGQQFLDSLVHRVPDCILMDVHMPGLNGFVVQARLAAMSVRIPTIIITGHDGPELREQALREGAAAFLRKPVDGQVLLEAILNAVKQSAPPPRDEHQ